MAFFPAVLVFCLVASLMVWMAQRMRWAVASAKEAADSARQTLESITDGLITLGPDDRYESINPEAEKLLRKSACELLGQRFGDVFPELSSVAHEQIHRATHSRANSKMGASL